MHLCIVHDNFRHAHYAKQSSLWYWQLVSAAGKEFWLTFFPDKIYFWMHVFDTCSICVMLQFFVFCTLLWETRCQRVICSLFYAVHAWQLRAENKSQVSFLCLFFQQEWEVNQTAEPAKHNFLTYATEGARTSDWQWYKLVGLYWPVIMVTAVGKSTIDAVIQ